MPNWEELFQNDRREQIKVCQELAPDGLLYSLDRPWKALEDALRNRNFENNQLCARVPALEERITNMKKNTDGSVTLSQEEFAEINEAYQALYDILDCMPSCIGHYFVEHEDYLNMMKWRHQLNGERFDRSDYE